MRGVSERWNILDRGRGEKMYMGGGYFRAMEYTRHGEIREVVCLTGNSYTVL